MKLANRNFRKRHGMMTKIVTTRAQEITNKKSFVHKLTLNAKETNKLTARQKMRP